MSIWCVEDDASIRDIEIYTLNAMGLEARGFASPSDFFKALEQEHPDLILLDIMLPERDGVSVLKQLKSNPQTKEIPILMATAKGAEYNKVESLDLGADDYLVKPFGMMEMVSRVKAVLRRCTPPLTEEILQWGELQLDSKRHEVTLSTRSLSLTHKEFELLRLFLSRPGIVFTRDQLLACIWGETLMPETRTVDVHIRTLRSKLGPYGKHIQTVRQVGYRMEAHHP